MLTLIATVLFAVAADPVAEARQALADGLPSVAAKKLESVRQGSADPEATLLLAQALIQNGRPEEAVELLRANPVPGGGDFWLAQSLAALGEWEAALRAYRAAGEHEELLQAATVGQGRMLRNLGRGEEAMEVLASAISWPPGFLQRTALLDQSELLLEAGRETDALRTLRGVSAEGTGESARRDFLMARGLAASGDDRGAVDLLEHVSASEPKMAVAITLERARALLRLGEAAGAESALEEFLSKNPDLPGLEDLFEALDGVYASQKGASSSELKRWAGDRQPSLRKHLASLYLARVEMRAGREDRAQKLLDDLADESDVTRDEAVLELASLFLRQKKPLEALKLLPPAVEEARADFLRGLALSLAGSASGSAFSAAARDPALSEAALYNAALSEMPDGRALEAFQKAFPGSPKLPALRLQQGFQAARRGDPSALSIFAELAAERDPVVANSARLALAEAAYEAGDREAASADLRKISTAAGGDVRAEADALSVFLADDGTNDAAAISAARSFLAAHPDSPSEAEVMMKLGELLFRSGDFAGARVALESLAEKHPGTGLEMPARFLAAQAASRVQTADSANDALLLFEEVASSNSPLAGRARFEQAVLQNVLGKPAEALVILDGIVASPGADEDLKAAARVEKGKTLYSQGGVDPKFYADARDVWMLVASDPGSSAAWRAQALVRAGAACEKLGDVDSAVAAYYDVIKAGTGNGLGFYWFYKAGFGAARLLETSKKWEQAIKVYELVAAAGGPRSEEALSRINKIKLENFLWDEGAGS